MSATHEKTPCDDNHSASSSPLSQGKGADGWTGAQGEEVGYKVSNDSDDDREKQQMAQLQNLEEHILAITGASSVDGHGWDDDNDNGNVERLILPKNDEENIACGSSLIQDTSYKRERVGPTVGKSVPSGASATAGIDMDSLVENRDARLAAPPNLSRNARDRHPQPGVIAVYPPGAVRRDESDATTFVVPSHQQQRQVQDAQGHDSIENHNGLADEEEAIPSSRQELLLTATLVETETIGRNNTTTRNNDDDMLVVEAQPAKEGLSALVANRHFKFVMIPVIIVLVISIVVPLSIVQRGTNNNGSSTNNNVSNDNPNSLQNCGSRSADQSDYRGTLNVTETGLPCQPWSSQTPQSHGFYAEHELYDLTDNNYCRNPDIGVEPRAWCYTMDPESRWAYCDIPFCNEDELVLKENCGTLAAMFTDYRGTINITASGKTCARWDSETPHVHGNKPDNRPNTGLVDNYCRNPDGFGAFCHTTDPGTSREYCDVPICNTLKLENSTHDTPCKNCTVRQCGSLRYHQRDYRGQINTTIQGYTCQRWDTSIPHSHEFDAMLREEFSLEENYCRSPQYSHFGEPFAWCHTTDPLKRMDFCDIPVCSEDNFIPRRYCGSKSTSQSDYRGDIAITESGKECVDWPSNARSENLDTTNTLFTRNKYPWDGLVRRFCRNPDGAHERAWCYTGETDSEWEYCDVSNCQYCGTTMVNKADYSGTESSTISGKTCLPWEGLEEMVLVAIDYPTDDTNVTNGTFLPIEYQISVPSNGKVALDRYKIREDHHLEANYCRNPRGYRKTVWCFTKSEGNISHQPLEVEWDYCDVPDCDEDGPPTSTACGSYALRQKDYRGKINVTVSGRECQSWSNQVPHAHEYTPESYPSYGLEENYCRNPLDTIFTGAWCFTNDVDVIWEYCDVPTCEDNNRTITIPTGQEAIDVQAIDGNGL